MRRMSRDIVILAGIASCALFLGGHSAGPTAEAQAKDAEKAPNPYEAASVLVEAFVVEVRLAALYELGVSPIGQKPHAASVEDIARCLKDENKARVVSGAKLTVGPRARATMKSTESVHAERQETEQTAPEPARAGARPPVRPRGSTTWRIGSEFEVSAFVRANERILVDYKLSQDTLRDLPPIEGEPVDSLSWNWAGSLYVDAGEPAIAGAVQNEETVVFLIISADITGK
ncbi:MAG: hypothetical protein JSU94_19855 [Phycisphaerales bacterium]|nr:MAG: hypothetical protein JSU94_19855 [Phycisphaerales bacterium]